MSEDKKVRVVICQPVENKTEDQIRQERATLVKELEGKGCQVVDTIFPDFPGTKNAPLLFLARSLACIADVDKVVFMPGWEDARGCKIEHTACLEYGVEVEYYKK
jgi:hypothetical protein